MQIRSAERFIRSAFSMGRNIWMPPSFRRYTFKPSKISWL